MKAFAQVHNIYHIVRATFFFLVIGKPSRLGDATITISDAIYTTNFGAQTNK